MNLKPDADSSLRNDEASDNWQRFLADEGLEVLAAYRAIRSPDIRAMYIRLMKEAAQAERESNLGMN